MRTVLFWKFFAGLLAVIVVSVTGRAPDAVTGPYYDLPAIELPRSALELELQHVANRIEQQGIVPRFHFSRVQIQELDSDWQRMAHSHFVAMSDGRFLLDANPIPGGERAGGRYVVAPIDAQSNFASRIAQRGMHDRNGLLVAAVYPNQRPVYKGILWTHNIPINRLYEWARRSIAEIPLRSAPIMHR